MLRPRSSLRVFLVAARFIGTIATGFEAVASTPPSTPISLQIRETILASKSSRMEDALSKLPVPLRRGFTFVHSSQSRLETNFQFPAALLFGDDAKTLVAFNGHSSQRGFAALDLLEFDEFSGRYRPARFLFEPSQRDLATAEVTERISNSNVYFEAEPRACARCHGEANHPIFESGYPEWKGFYGSDRDHLYGSTSKEEVSGFKKFQKMQKSNPRYAALIFPTKAMSSMSPYMDEATEMRAPKGYGYAYRPNLMFGAYLVRNNAVGIVKKLKSSPDYVRLRSALAFSLERCDFSLISKLRIQALRQEFEPFKNLKLNSTSFLNREHQLNREFGAQIAAKLGVTADWWSLSLPRSGQTDYGYWSGYGDTLDFVHADLARDIFGSRVQVLYSSVDPLNDASEGGTVYSRRLTSLGASLKPRGSQSCRELANAF